MNAFDQTRPISPVPHEILFIYTEQNENCVFKIFEFETTKLLIEIVYKEIYMLMMINMSTNYKTIA